MSAFITPVPETKKEGGDEVDWERVRRAVLSAYGAAAVAEMACPVANDRRQREL